MKLPIPSLLYVVSAGLFGLAGWTIYGMLPLLKEETRMAATKRGMDHAVGRLSRGRGQGPVSLDWQYTRGEWWAEFRNANFLGKEPPKPTTGPGSGNEPPPPPPPPPVQPLEQIIELVSLVYDGKEQGRGGTSHVIVRYRPEANVQPPEWYVRENLGGQAPMAAPAAPRDTAPPRGGRPAAGTAAPRPTAPPRPGAAMPTSIVGREILQQVWVVSDGDPRHEPRLFPPFQHIRLVRVSDDAQVAYFVRDPVAPPPGQPAVAPQEEELIKTVAPLDQAVLRELRRLQGRADRAGAGDRQTPAGAAASSAGASGWVEVEVTTQIGNVRHIGREDERRFASSDELFDQVNVDTYVSKYGNTRGLQVRNVDPQLSSRFGVGAGDVLLEVNGRPVQTKAQAVQFGKSEYQKGVRTFTTKWLTGSGQIVERIYQAPDK